MKLINKYFNEIILGLLVMIIFITNYVPGTYLTGWDNLQTDLNPYLAVKRAIFSVWQEYQSFGLTAGMAHAADLPRALFLWVISFFIPQNAVRYFFQILMLFVGGIGFLKLFIHINHEDKHKFIGLLGSIFYILNYGTIQIFYVPFEPFSIFFAAFPWLIWIFLKYIEKPYLSRSVLLKLIFINFIFSSFAYLQTLFVVYLIILGIISLVEIFKNKNHLKNIIIAFISIIIINSYWILPQIYFLKNNVQVVKNAKMNQLATEDVYYQNKEKGNIYDFIKMEGFYTDLNETSQKPLFQAWKNHFNNFYYLQIIAFIIILFGFFQKNKYKINLLITYFFLAFIFLNNTPGIKELNDLIRQNIDFLNQIFRSPFTKFVIPYSLIGSIFFTYGLIVIKDYIFKKNHSKVFEMLIFIFLIIYALPVFFGNYFSSSLRVKIPQDYLDTISYFKTVNKNSRIALLPEYTFWGWYYNKWGYNGSGFLWYGIEQPIISRTFDVWSSNSESYFWEIKTALDSEDVDLFAKIIDKYEIDYLIFDKSILPISSSLKGMQVDRTKTLIEKNTNINLLKETNNLIIYQIINNNHNFIKSYSTTLTNISPKINTTDKDFAFLNFNNYKIDPDKNTEVIYPFLNFFSTKKISDKKWQISENTESFFVKTKIDFNQDEYDLIIPNQNNQISLYKQNKNIIFANNFEANIIDKELIIKIPKKKIEKYLPISLNDDKCENKEKYYCFGFDFPYAENKYGYLAKIINSNKQGRKMFFYVQDKTKKTSIIEDRLSNDIEYYLLGKGYDYGIGYIFSFQSEINAVNILSSLNLYLFPVDEIKQIYFIKKGFLPDRNIENNDLLVEKINYFLYTINIKNKPTTLVLNQSYNKGWILVEKNNLLKIKKSFIVNNWANGWEINNSNESDYYIVYLPQLLQFIAFLMILAFCSYLIKYKL